jgi:hypothetical protein
MAYSFKDKQIHKISSHGGRSHLATMESRILALIEIVGNVYVLLDPEGLEPGSANLLVLTSAGDLLWHATADEDAIENNAFVDIRITQDRVKTLQATDRAGIKTMFAVETGQQVGRVRPARKVIKPAMEPKENDL